jgi:two-component system, chemotaxis family, protein-glutamate methylesterase/glutaminase
MNQEMEKIKVLIADDSVIYRSQIRAALEDVSRLEVVGVCSNGRVAIEKLTTGGADVLILDLEMPEMDGLETLKALSKLKNKCQVLLFSSATKEGSVLTLEALKLGAADFITKPDGTNLVEGLSPSQKIKNLLSPKILALFPETQKMQLKSNLQYSKVNWDLFQPKVVVIGSSTGGPTVLEKIFSVFKGPLHCPVLITQHMPPVFTATLAERISSISGLPAREGRQGEYLENAIYLAPGNFHMKLKGTLQKPQISLDQTEQVNSVRPAVDHLFATAASIYKNHCLGIVLTGMGADGKVGAESIKKEAGAVVIQNKESCVVFGMPGAVQVSGAYDFEANPERIIEILEEKVGRKSNV